tara:strand:- start:169 stop:477 length:309 start_codon:yes stop_codon:yes gene_type:complete
MTHYAKVDNEIVEQVIVADAEFVNNLSGEWIETSPNDSIRKNYAGKGYTYDATRDAFISPQPYPSWTLNEDTCQWEAPIAYPDDVEKVYIWDEETTNWKEIE